MNRVTHFEIHADNPTRAANFYKTVFGWGITKWDGPVHYWIITTGTESQPGINGGILQRQGGTGDSVIAYICTISVESLDDCEAKILANGGIIALPKHPVPKVGWAANYKDSEGNIFGLLEPNANV